MRISLILVELLELMYIFIESLHITGYVSDRISFFLFPFGNKASQVSSRASISVGDLNMHDHKWISQSPYDLFTCQLKLVD